MNTLARVLTLVCAGSLCVAGLAAQTYRIARRVPLGGEGGWGYLSFDADARRIYVPRDNQITVFSPDSLKVVGQIPNTPGVRNITFYPELGRGFTTNGANNTVTVFDRKTLKTLGTMRVGDGPNGILCRSPYRVLTANEHGRNLSVVDAKTGRLLGSIMLGGRPHALQADNEGFVLVDVAGTNEIAKVDLANYSVMARWPLNPGKRPAGMAFDYRNRRLFVACGNRRLIVMDATSGRIVAVLPVGAKADALRFDVDARILFCANGDGTLTIIRQDSPDKYRVVQTLSTAPGAHTLTLDRKTHKVYTVAGRFDKASGRPVPGSLEAVVIEAAQN